MASCGVGKRLDGFSPILAAATVACVLLGSACGWRNGGDVVADVEEPFPEKLSAWQLFVGKASERRPNRRVIPYGVATPLFKDYATKHRFVWMPPGTAAVYHPTATFEFPVGTIIVKTFAYPTGQGAERWIETRLLVHAKSGWVGLPYVWNRDETEAYLDIAPDPTVVHWRDPSGRARTIDYAIPNTNQCKNCHENAKVMMPLGPKARNLNQDYDYPEGRANQLAYWTRIGYLRGAPPPQQAPRAVVWNDPSSASLETRARTYLDVNCANCHNAKGPANNTGLYLGIEVTDALRLGICKVPVAAGPGGGDLRFDIVPGKPEQSILVRRMNSVTPKVMMPELGRSVIDEEGVALTQEWIASLQADCEGTGSSKARQMDTKDSSSLLSPGGGTAPR